jgi:hypothetical protein
MTRAWFACQDRFIHTRSAEFCPGSPNVVPFSIAKLQEMENAGVDWRTFIPTIKKTNKKGDK